MKQPIKLVFRFEPLEKPSPAGAGVFGVVIGSDGAMQEAQTVYGRMWIRPVSECNWGPPIGIGEPMCTADVQRKYMDRLARDVFGESATTTAIRVCK